MNRLKFLAALAVLLAFSSGAVVGMLGRDIRRDVLIPATGQSSLAEELSLTPEQSAAFIKAEVEKWAAVARSADIQIE